MAMVLGWTGSGRAAGPEMKLSISIDHSLSYPPTLRWQEAERTPHFYVLLTNISDAPKNIDGDEFVRFVVTDEFGQSRQVFRQLGVLFRNGPHLLALNPGECRIFEIYFADRKTWGDSFWLPAGHPSGRLTLQAIYQSHALDIPPKGFLPGTKTPRPDPPIVWEGTVTSPPVECVIK